MATYYGRKYSLLELKHRFKELFLTTKIAFKSDSLGKPQTKEPLYIAMVDGEAYHGGMCDRFKGIITLYAYCNQNLPFRIRYTYPFRLEDYLSPQFMIGRFAKENIRIILYIAESYTCEASIWRPGFCS